MAGEVFEFTYEAELNEATCMDIEDCIVKEIQDRFPGKTGDDVERFSYAIKVEVVMKGE